MAQGPKEDSFKTFKLFNRFAPSKRAAEPFQPSAELSRKLVAEYGIPTAEVTRQVGVSISELLKEAVRRQGASPAFPV
jgi:hypothetical protein